MLRRFPKGAARENAARSRLGYKWFENSFDINLDECRADKWQQGRHLGVYAIAVCERLSQCGFCSSDHAGTARTIPGTPMREVPL